MDQQQQQQQNANAQPQDAGDANAQQQNVGDANAQQQNAGDANAQQQNAGGAAAPGVARAAAPVIPDDWYGNRIFANRASRPSHSKLSADSAARNVQALYLQWLVADDDRRRTIEETVEGLRYIVETSDAASERELSTRRMQPVSNYATTVFGHNDSVGNIRTNQIPTFKGYSKDPHEVVRWINKVLIVAAGQKLSQEGTKNLLATTSQGGVSEYIEEMKTKEDLLGIITCLEMRYGELVDPETAHIKCGELRFRGGDDPADFVDQLRAMARHATKEIRDPDLRAEEIGRIISINIVKNLTPDARLIYDGKVATRKSQGNAPYTHSEIETLCIQLLRKSNDAMASAAPIPPRRPAYGIRAVSEYDPILEEDPDALTDQEELGEDELSILDPGLVCEIRKAKQYYAGRQPPVSDKKIYRKAFAMAKRKTEQNPPRGAVRAAFTGPPGRLQDGPRRSIMEMLRDANCARGECIQCGSPGHLMYNEACGLRGKVITDRACMKCHKGLHAADDCPRVYQTRQADISHQISVLIETLNEHEAASPQLS